MLNFLAGGREFQVPTKCRSDPVGIRSTQTDSQISSRTQSQSYSERIRAEVRRYVGINVTNSHSLRSNSLHTNTIHSHGRFSVLSLVTFRGLEGHFNTYLITDYPAVELRFISFFSPCSDSISHNLSVLGTINIGRRQFGSLTCLPDPSSFSMKRFNEPVSTGISPRRLRASAIVFGGVSGRLIGSLATDTRAASVSLKFRSRDGRFIQRHCNNHANIIVRYDIIQESYGCFGYG